MFFFSWLGAVFIIASYATLGSKFVSGFVTGYSSQACTTFFGTVPGSNSFCECSYHFFCASLADGMNDLWVKGCSNDLHPYKRKLTVCVSVFRCVCCDRLWKLLGVVRLRRSRQLQRGYSFWLSTIFRPSKPSKRGVKQISQWTSVQFFL